MKASGKSSFTTFVDLGMYQAPGGTGDNISVGGVIIVCTAYMINYLIFVRFVDRFVLKLQSVTFASLLPSVFETQYCRVFYILKGTVHPKIKT